jgi:hypothetical protein
MIARILALVLATEMSTCEQQRQSVDPASAPSRLSIPMDLSLYSENELRIYAARCDQEIAAALSRNDVASAQGWAQVRSEVQVAISRKNTPYVIAAPRDRHAAQEVPASWYETHHKEWNSDHTRWRYVPNAASSRQEQLDELIRRYRQLQ